MLAGVLMFGLSLAAAAQGGTTRVRGVVTDSETGDPLPFAGVYFEGTSIGVSTDMNGRYSLETRSAEARVLSAHLLGYESLSFPVQQGAFAEINFSLVPDPHQLQAALVKPDTRHLRSILKKLDSSLDRNNPENGPDYSSRLYSKIEFDISNAKEILDIGFIDRRLGFLKNYRDTSAITGQTIIPAIISENVSDIYHSREPSFEREVMRFCHVSGFGKDEQTLLQYTGAQLIKANFYRRSISVLNLDIPNPAASSSHLFYNYYLVDSLDIEERKTYVLRFRPKKLVTSPTLDGEMHIDAGDFGIRSVRASLSKSSNVNWVRHLNIDIENRRTPEGLWFHGEERLFVDFSVSARDSSRLLSLIGRRHLCYDPPVYGPVGDKDALSSDNRVVDRDVRTGTPQQWEALRPYPLSAREQGIFEMVDEFQQTPLYKWTYSILRTVIGGYYRIPGTGFEAGRWARFFVRNETEGVRLRFGGRTYHPFSEKLRLGGYLAYGLKDKRLKGEAFADIMFRRDKTRKLAVKYREDYIQLGTGMGVFSAQTVISSLVARNHANMPSYIRSFNLIYEHEFAPSVNSVLEWSTVRIWGNDLVPLERPDGRLQESFSANTLHATLRFSKDEKVTRNYYRKAYLYTKYPVLTLEVSGGIKGLTRDDISYLRPEATLSWKTPSSAVGFGQLNLNAGAILGSIPYPLLKLHEGNQTYFMDRAAFSCMDYYEFMSDRWVSGFYEHNFNGLFLGKIPLLKKLDLREVVTARMAWGSLSEANSVNAPFLLPKKAGTLEKPYVELGAGISNILRIFRVDAFWRITHRHEDEKKNFTVNLGMDLEF